MSEAIDEKNAKYRIEELKVFKSLVSDLHDSVTELASVWSNLDYTNEVVGAGYPFERPLDEYPGALDEWIKRLNDEIRFEKWRMTRRLVLELNDLQDEFGVGDGDIQGPGLVYENMSYIQRLPYEEEKEIGRYLVTVGNQQETTNDLLEAERYLWEEHVKDNS